MKKYTYFVSGVNYISGTETKCGHFCCTVSQIVPDLPIPDDAFNAILVEQKNKAAKSHNGAEVYTHIQQFNLISEINL